MGGTELAETVREAVSLVPIAFGGADGIADGANDDIVVLLLYSLCLDAPDPETASSIGNSRSPNL
jgi:hypothetical protein